MPRITENQTPRDMQRSLNLGMSAKKGEVKMKLTLKIIVGLLLAPLLCLSAYAQEFLCGKPNADYLDPNTANA